MLDFSAAEIEAVRLSLRIAFWAMVGSLPFGLATAIILARGRFYGKSLLDGVVHLPLVMPPVVTGYLLLLLFGRNGPLGRFLDESFGIVFAFRWTGAALACAVMGFPLLVRAIRLSLEGGRPPARRGCRHTRRQEDLCIRARDLAIDRPGDRRRHGVVLRPQSRRIWCYDYVRFQHPRGDPDHRFGDLHPDPNSRRRCRRAETHPRLDSAVVCRAARCRSSGEAPGPAPFRRLNAMLEVDIEHRLADFALDIHFQAGRGLTALFGRSGAGKTSVVNAIAGLLRPRRGRIVMDGSVLLDTERGIRVPTPSATGSGMSSRRAGFSRILPSGKTCCLAAGSPRLGKGAPAISTSSSICSASLHCSTAGRAGFQAAKSSASRSAAHCWRARGCC